jgi:hypothetical protein
MSFSITANGIDLSSCEIRRPTAARERFAGKAAGLALCGDHRAQLQAREELVGRFLLERADLERGPLGLVVAALEVVDHHDHGEELAARRLVGDVVRGDHRGVVAMDLGGEAGERLRVADHVLELAVDFVGEARQVGRALDALAVLGAGGEREPGQEDRDEEAFHGVANSRGQRAEFYQMGGRGSRRPPRGL